VTRTAPDVRLICLLSQCRSGLARMVATSGGYRPRPVWPRGQGLALVAGQPFLICPGASGGLGVDRRAPVETSHRKAGCSRRHAAPP
jgi:hypothetical protein